MSATRARTARRRSTRSRWTNPILVDENAGILAGHGRLLAARKLGLGEVPVIRFEHLSEAQKRAYILADNQIALQAGWDDALLAEELAWLRDGRLASLGPTLGVRRLGRRGARVRLLGGRRRLGLLVLRLDADGPRGRRG
jgi:ParB-like chromosome segregation protein Spo0J